jgi:type IV pilus assembly protein PilX
MTLHPSSPFMRTARSGLRRASRGVSLLFSLITLVALSLAAVALIRAVDTGSILLGNLGFKQDTLLAADEATRQAIVWLSGKVGGTDLHSNQPTQGYYANGGIGNSQTARLDPTGTGSNSADYRVGWEQDPTCSGRTNCLTPINSFPLANNVTAQYIILRLCDAQGDPNASGGTLQCARPMSATVTTAAQRDDLTYASSQRFGSSVLTQYYRIVVRAKGARNTVSYTDTVVHF